jgi:O-antigen/teichoic acid export membrane protein
MKHVRQLWDRIPPLVRGLGIIALIAVVVIVLRLEPVLGAIGGLLRIAFFLAIAFFLFLVWRERRGDLEAWQERNLRLFYAAIILAVVAIGLWIGWGFSEPNDILALLLVLAACVFAVVRIWRLEHRYD